MLNFPTLTSILSNFAAALVADSSSGSGSTIKDYVTSLLSFDWKTLIAHLISSIFILICVVYWFWKPTNTFIQRHKEQLNKTYRDLSVANRESQRYVKQLKTESHNMASIKENTIAQVKKDAEGMILKAREAAKVEANIILDNARSKAKAMEETAHTVIKNSVVNLSIDLTKKLVGDNINEKSAEKIIDTYISDMESKSISDEFKH